MAIKATPVVPGKRVYPHVTEIADWPTQQTTRLLWDRIHDLAEQLTAAQGTITQLVAGHNTSATQIAAVTQDAQTALALSQQPGTSAASLSGSSGGTAGPTPTLPGGGDGGQGQVGCAAAGATGHDTGGLLNAVRAGQIVCGTGNEFSALKNATPDAATRQANAEELVLRMIWHLRLAGFTAGRQQNPSGAISNDKLCVVVDGVTRAYDVFTGAHAFASPMSTQMSEVAPAHLVDAAGTPD